jgi:hypothetical protein
MPEPYRLAHEAPSGLHSVPRRGFVTGAAAGGEEERRCEGINGRSSRPIPAQIVWTEGHKKTRRCHASLIRSILSGPSDQTRTPLLGRRSSKRTRVDSVGGVLPRLVGLRPAWAGGLQKDRKVRQVSGSGRRPPVGVSGLAGACDARGAFSRITFPSHHLAHCVGDSSSLLGPELDGTVGIDEEANFKAGPPLVLGRCRRCRNFNSESSRGSSLGTLPWASVLSPEGVGRICACKRTRASAPA